MAFQFSFALDCVYSSSWRWARPKRAILNREGKLWLARLPMAEGFNLNLKLLLLQLTPREYLETALHSVEGRGASVEAKNHVSILLLRVSGF